MLLDGLDEAVKPYVSQGASATVDAGDDRRAGAELRDLVAIEANRHEHMRSLARTQLGGKSHFLHMARVPGAGRGREHERDGQFRSLLLPGRQNVADVIVGDLDFEDPRTGEISDGEQTLAALH